MRLSLTPLPNGRRVPRARTMRRWPVLRRVGGDDGFAMIELVIAMTILVVGIMAIVAGFSSGMDALKRASRATAAGAIADKQMEQYRQMPWASVPVATTIDPSVTGGDGRSYWVESAGSWSCPPAGTTLDLMTTPETCKDGSGTVVSEAVKLMTITVRDGSATSGILISTSSTFLWRTG